MPWKERSVMDERLRFVARLLDGEAMSEVCRAFGISRKTGYKIFDHIWQQSGADKKGKRSSRCQVRTGLPAGGSWIRTFGPAVRGTAVGRAPAPDHRRLARAPALNDRHPGLSVRHLPSITPIDPFARAGPEVQIRLPPAGSLPRTRSSQR